MHDEVREIFAGELRLLGEPQRELHLDRLRSVEGVTNGDHRRIAVFAFLEEEILADRQQY